MLDREHLDIIRKHMRANDHAKTVLKAIAERHDQILISNATPAHIAKFLGIIGLGGFFPDGKYFGTDAHQPGIKLSKKDLADEYMHGRTYDCIIVIGDSPQDMIPLPSAVSYLYAHPGLPFRECAATYRIRDLRDILREI